MRNEIVERVKAAFTLSDVIGRKVKLRKAGRNFSGLCPFHNEKSPSFSVSDERGYYKCFGCGANGDVFNFVMETEGLSFPEALEKLSQEAGIKLPEFRAESNETKARKEQNKSIYDVLHAACEYFQHNLNTASGSSVRDYLKKRGLNQQVIEKFAIGFAPSIPFNATSQFALGLLQSYSREMLIDAGLISIADNAGRVQVIDKFRNRLMFPIHDERGRVVGFGGRALSDSQKPKYLNSSEGEVFKKSELLYSYHIAREAALAGKPVILAEGYMDVVALYQYGFQASVAPMGTAITEQQLKKLWRLSSNPFVCLDSDGAGIKASYRLAELALTLLKSNFSLSFIFLNKGDDPDSFLKLHGAEAFQGMINNARPLAEVLWLRESGNFINKTPEVSAVAEKRLKELVKSIPDETIRHYYGEYFKSKIWELRKGDRGFNNRRAGEKYNQKPMPRSDQFSNPEGDSKKLLRVRLESLLITLLAEYPECMQHAEIEARLMSLELLVPDGTAIIDLAISRLEKSETDEPAGFDSANTQAIKKALGRIQKNAGDIKPYKQLSLDEKKSTIVGIINNLERMKLDEERAYLINKASENLDEQSWNRLLALKESS